MDSIVSLNWPFVNFLCWENMTDRWFLFSEIVYGHDENEPPIEEATESFEVERIWADRNEDCEDIIPNLAEEQGKDFADDAIICKSLLFWSVIDQHVSQYNYLS